MKINKYRYKLIFVPVCIALLVLLINKTNAFSALQVRAEENNEIKSETNDIFMKYQEVEFADTEKEYIQAKKYLKVGYLSDNAPFQYASKGNNTSEHIEVFDGLCSDICDNLQMNTGLRMQYICYSNTEQMISALEKKEIDMIAGIENQQKYKDRVVFSKEFIEYLMVLVRNDAIDIENMENVIQATVRGELSSIDLPDTVNVTEYSTIYEMLKSIDRMDTHFGIINFYSADYYIRLGSFSHSISVPLTHKVKMSFGYGKDVDTRLISICNKCLYSMTEDNIYFLLTRQMDTSRQQVTLKNYIEANPFQSIVLCVVVIAIVMLIVIIFQNEKAKSAKEHAIDIKRYETLSRLMDEYVFEYDFETDMIHFDAKFFEKFDFGGDIKISRYDYDNPSLNKLLELCEEAKQREFTSTQGFELSDKNGDVQWYRMTAYRIVQNGISTQHLIGKILNIQKEMEEQLKIKERAETDMLTGLNNIVGFEACYNKLMNEWHDISSVAFGIIDFDDFKNINDTLGHAGGDEALILLAEKINKLCNDNVIAARYGGDEFYLCAFGLKREEADKLFDTIVKSMDIELSYQSQCHHISVSLGAVYSPKKLPYTILFKEADQVLYKVKSIGKNSYRMIDHMGEI